MPHEIPKLSLQKVPWDIFNLDSKSYLLIVGYLLKFNNMSTKTKKKNLENVLVIREILLKMMTDNTPFQSFEFKQLGSTSNIKTTQCMSISASINGLTETIVQAVKKLINRVCQTVVKNYG